MSLEVHNKLQTNLEFFAANAPLMIKPKQGNMIPLVLNKPQKYIHAALEKQLNDLGRVRALILKGRQEGCSTYVGARFYHKATRNKAQNVFILTHEADATENLYAMVENYHEYCHPAARPRIVTANRKRMRFSNASQYQVSTAGNKKTGRSGTTQLFHGSEVAFWENTDDISAGALETVGDIKGTEIILESTANGMTGMFYKMCQQARRGEGDYQLIFVPWFWLSDYSRSVPADFERTDDEQKLVELYGLTDSQLVWRRAKIASKQGKLWLFKQEYPCNIDEAFQTSGDSLIPVEAIIRARKSEITDRNAPLVMGVDPAFKRDRCAIAFRRGREVPMIYTIDCSKEPIDSMTLVGKIAQYMQKHQPAKVFIDIGEGGRGVVDRLLELGFGRYVHAINFGSRASDDAQYLNKRAEMWCVMRDWLMSDEGSNIPDTDDVQADLACVPQYRLNSNSRIVLVSKDKIREDFGMSPDIGDALALTFAAPVHRDLALSVQKATTRGSGVSTMQRRRRKWG